MPTLRTKILEKANTEAITKDLDMSNELCEAGGYTYGIIPAKNDKPIKHACKVAFIRSRRPGLEKGL